MLPHATSVPSLLILVKNDLLKKHFPGFKEQIVLLKISVEHILWSGLNRFYEGLIFNSACQCTVIHTTPCLNTNGFAFFEW